MTNKTFEQSHQKDIKQSSQMTMKYNTLDDSIGEMKKMNDLNRPQTQAKITNVAGSMAGSVNHHNNSSMRMNHDNHNIQLINNQIVNLNYTEFSRQSPNKHKHTGSIISSKMSDKKVGKAHWNINHQKQTGFSSSFINIQSSNGDENEQLGRNNIISKGAGCIASAYSKNYMKTNENSHIRSMLTANKDPPFFNPVGPGQYNIRETLDIGHKTHFQGFRNSPSYSMPKQQSVHQNINRQQNESSYAQSDKFSRNSVRNQFIQEAKSLIYMRQKMKEVSPSDETVKQRSPVCKFSKYERPDIFPVQEYIKKARKSKSNYQSINNDVMYRVTRNSFGTEQRDKLRVYHPEIDNNQLNGQSPSPGPAVYDPLKSTAAFQTSMRPSFPKADRNLRIKGNNLPGPDSYYKEFSEKQVINREPQAVIPKARRNLDMRVQKGLY
ncbi:UNKNOWN [Stylonychia lemnae]|uniref:Uncharacterized protein n=1 Tax=Stylonychia lemnae TaxID=5949 RepID=A0A078ACH5_STYLE|nr:UNKNOWN [Stylonychia lemnae]|eukprot:CDW79879.1 UNKNOWN [Stylonychia lemnae]